MPKTGKSEHERNYYADLATYYAQCPPEDFSIIAWDGHRRNVKAEIVDTYRHLARCPFRHSARRDLLDVTFCLLWPRTHDGAQSADA